MKKRKSHFSYFANISCNYCSICLKIWPSMRYKPVHICVEGLSHYVREFGVIDYLLKRVIFILPIRKKRTDGMGWKGVRIPVSSVERSEIKPLVSLTNGLEESLQNMCFEKKAIYCMENSIGKKEILTYFGWFRSVSRVDKFWCCVGLVKCLDEVYNSLLSVSDLGFFIYINIKKTCLNGDDIPLLAW